MHRRFEICVAERGFILKIVRNPEKIKFNNASVAIGKFDGLHRGHHILIDELRKDKERGLTTVIFTFSKSPLTIEETSDVRYILTKDEKYHFYEQCGIDVVIEYPLCNSLIHMDREDFLKSILIEKIGMKKIICGTEFKFGYMRKGTKEYLIENAEMYGYEVKVFEKLKEGIDDISSTLIREHIRKGEIEAANKLLGYPYMIVGEIVHGNEIGRTINYPTANIIPDREKLLPPNGVYFTRVDIDGVSYKCITNIGIKPTVTENKMVGVESNIIGYHGDLYGRSLCFEFMHYHRTEKKFESLDELKKQLVSDEKCCKEYIM